MARTWSWKRSPFSPILWGSRRIGYYCRNSRQMLVVFWSAYLILDGGVSLAWGGSGILYRFTVIARHSCHCIVGLHQATNKLRTTIWIFGNWLRLDLTECFVSRCLFWSIERRHVLLDVFRKYASVLIQILYAIDFSVLGFLRIKELEIYAVGFCFLKLLCRRTSKND